MRRTSVNRDKPPTIRKLNFKQFIKVIRINFGFKIFLLTLYYIRTKHNTKDSYSNSNPAKILLLLTLLMRFQLMRIKSTTTLCEIIGETKKYLKENVIVNIFNPFKKCGVWSKSIQVSIVRHKKIIETDKKYLNYLIMCISTFIFKILFNLFIISDNWLNTSRTQ